MSDVNPIVNGGYSSPQSIYETSTTKNHVLGTKGVLNDGRVFYYAKSTGAAITRGNLCRAAAEDSVGITTSIVAASDAAAGATSISLTLGAGSVSAGQFEDGTLIVIDGTNSGQERRIEYHASATNATAVNILLAAPLEAAITASSEEISLVRNKYADVVVTPGDSVVQVVGAPQVNVGSGATDAQYFWMQTYGRASVVGDDATYVLGGQVTYATSTTADAGQCTIFAASASTASITPRFVIGTLDSLGDATSDGDFRLVDLRIRA